MLQITSPAIASYFGLIYNILSGIVGPPILWPLAFVISFLIFIIILSILFSLFAYVFGWVERKIIGRAHARHGPTYVGPFGLLQNLADLVKLMSKENILPDKADKPIYQMILPIVVALVCADTCISSIHQRLCGDRHHPWPACRLCSAFLLSTPALPCGMDQRQQVRFDKRPEVRDDTDKLRDTHVSCGCLCCNAGQQPEPHYNSGRTEQAVVCSADADRLYCVLYCSACRAGATPFDLREADSELIAGWLTDAGPPYYALALFLDYIRMFVGTLLITLLFFGGWLGPAILPAFAWLMIKVVILTVFIVIVRATSVRMRIDRVLQPWLGVPDPACDAQSPNHIYNICQVSKLVI